MKRCTFLLPLFFPLLGFAQSVSNDKQQDLLGKGHMNVGISVGEGYRGTYSKTNFVTPRLHYFLADGWSVALEGTYLTSNKYGAYNDADFTFIGGGVSTRYYFLRRNHLALFAQAGAVYGQSTFHNYPYYPEDRGITNNNWQTNAGLGAHYRLGKRWSVEVMAGRSWLQTSNDLPPFFYLSQDYNRWQVSVGINYRLK